MENFKKKSTLDKAIEKFYRIDDIKYMFTAERQMLLLVNGNIL